MNYLELVNKALDEAGQSLDPLTSTTFANPTGSKMYLRFKSWVAEAWSELQTDNKEAFFTNTLVVTPVCPRVRVYNLYAVDSVVGKQYYSANGGLMTIVAQSDAISGDPLLSSYNGFLDIEPLGGDYELLELGGEWTEDTLDPNPSTFNLSSFVGYKETELTSGVQTLTKLPIILKIDTAEHTVCHLEWKDWNHTLKNEYGVPRLYTMGPDGHLYFYPNLAEDATLIAYGNRVPEILSLYSNTPTGLIPAYHPIIYWGAVLKYANYDRDGKLWKTANVEYGKYYVKLCRDAGMLPRMQDSVYG